MFFEQLQKLCDLNNTTPSAVVANLGLGSSNVTRWKNGTAPNSDIVLKFSDYFNVTTDYLLKGNISSASLSNSDQQELLSLWDKLDPIKQAEFKGELKGYIKAMDENKK